MVRLPIVLTQTVLFTFEKKIGSLDIARNTDILSVFVLLGSKTDDGSLALCNLTTSLTL